MDPGEEPLAAAIRETAEEAALADLEFRWGHDFRETEPLRPRQGGTLLPGGVARRNGIAARQRRNWGGRNTTSFAGSAWPRRASCWGRACFRSCPGPRRASPATATPPPR
ncbi:MAG: hypothetical protein MZW92_05485 [Comamonadaceae bacterium]|nr:hypothetical protein [Comamonadaceae bacterium]